ncbi:hypothetical protein [Streptomyces liangshanensis]|uniref:hypothetical protein n=1 Tax=Streptomyces liangshanensis TaxID=2717324 RepID=UPI0036DC7F4A
MRTASVLLVLSAAGVYLVYGTLADLAPDSVCEGTGRQVDRLKGYGVLGSRPPGTVVPRGFEDLEAGCWEDSGESWLFAERTYVSPGSRAEVTAHYRAAAERDGWEPSRGTRRSAKDVRQTSLCFTREGADQAGGADGAGGTATLDVYFLTTEILAAEDSAPGPEFRSGAGYRVSVTAAADGSGAGGCSD